MPNEVVSLLTRVGVLVQLGITLLLVGLLVTLWLRSRVTEYLGHWTAGWIALLVALVTVALRVGLGPDPELAVPDSSPISRLLDAVYQSSKFLCVALFWLGIAEYLDRPVRLWMRLAALAAAILAGSLTGALAAGLDQVVMWQAAVIAPAFGVTTWLLLATPHDRPGVGVRILTLAFGVLALLWAVYFVAFQDPPWVRGVGATVLGTLAAYNSYVDAVVSSALGLGMVVALVEDTHRAADQGRQAQLADLARSERRLAEVLRAAHEGIVTLDSARRITVLNPAAEQIFGVTAPSAAGTPFDHYLAAEHRDTLWEELAVTTRRSEAHQDIAARREVTGLRADGQRLPLEIAISSVAGAGGRGYVLVVRDLTEQVRERDERERLQAQVAQAARLEAVGRMVSGVAHELNNPLTAIIAFAQDLQATARSEEDQEALAVIVQQAQRCRVIVGDLLIFARNQREQRRRVVVEDVVQRVLRVFERDSARRGVTLQTRIAPDLPAVEIDVAGIEQVLVNLLTNALHATPEGGQVTMRCEVRGECVELVVEDTGPGIPSESLPRVFEPFFTTKALGEGTGLGLSVSHSIVQHHGGSLVAENRDDVRSGARFTVSLPFVERRSADRSTGLEPGPQRPLLPAGHGRRVLVVDDEEAIRSAMRRSLERRGWVVDEAADGEEAMLHLDVGGQPGDFDVIVTDLRMPGVSGIELFHRLSARHPKLTGRIVIITGDTASPSVAEFLATAGRPFLQKPFDMRALVEMLDRIAGPAKEGS